MTRPHGKAVIDGVIQYLSVSQIQTFDSGTVGGCQRKWYYDKVEGRPRKTTAAQSLGTKLHSENEHYLLTGEDVLSPQARAGRRFLPEPMIHLSVEHAFAPGFTASGIPMVGYIDVINDSGFYLTDDGEAVAEDFPEVIDWKTTSSFAYAKNASELRDSVQMVTYAEYVSRRFDERPEKVRLSHGYFLTKGSPQARKVTCTIGIPEIQSKWDRIQATVDEMKAVAGIKTAQEVLPNYDACSAYGGCDYRNICLRGLGVFGQLAGVNGMGIMDKFKRVDSIATVEINPPDAVNDPSKAAEPIPPEVLITLPEAIQEAAQALKSPALVAAEVTVELVKTKRGRPAKAKPVEPANPASEPASKLELYVDVIVAGIHTKPLEDYIDTACSEIEAAFSVEDMRSAPADNALGYGKWKGVLAGYVRQNPPPSGSYTLADVRESEIRQTVIEALRPFCAVFVRGR